MQVQLPLTHWTQFSNNDNDNDNDEINDTNERPLPPLPSMEFPTSKTNSITFPLGTNDPFAIVGGNNNNSDAGPSHQRIVKPLPHLPPHSTSTTTNVREERPKPPPLMIPATNLASDIVPLGLPITFPHALKSRGSLKGKERAISPDLHNEDHGLQSISSTSSRQQSASTESNQRRRSNTLDAVDVNSQLHSSSIASKWVMENRSRRNSEELGWTPRAGNGIGGSNLNFERGVLGLAEGDERVGSNGQHLQGYLPPGAFPAVNPSASPTFELSTAGQYAILAGTTSKSNNAPPGVVPIPQRRTSLSTDHSHHQHLRETTYPASPVSYHYGTSPNEMYTVQAVTMSGTVVPLVSPSIGKRRSSMQPDDFFASKSLASLMSDVEGNTTASYPPHGTLSESPTEASVIGEAPQASALLRDAKTFSLAIQRQENEDSKSAAINIPPGTFEHRHSVPSLTHDSSFSETSSHTPLTSASNSLSRSTKSGKDSESVQIVVEETQGNEIDPDSTLLPPIPDAKQLAAQLARRMRKSDRRKCVLTELLETEVAYRGHLRDLVEIYSMELASLAAVLPEVHGMIMRNVSDVLVLHEVFCSRMLDVAVEEKLGSSAEDGFGVDDAVRTERLIQRLAALFVDMAPGFAVYELYCSQAASAMDAIRGIEHRSDWASFEKRCQAIAGSKLHLTLHQALAEGVPGFSIDSLPPPTLNGGPSRLMFRDLLILPVQRVCRYPFMLGALSLVAAATPSVHPDRPFDFQGGISSDVDKALAAMKDVAAKADAANEQSLQALRTLRIRQRLDPHPDLEPTFIDSLGPCRLAGPLEVLYHHIQLAPLISPVKVRYLVGFLYDGYIILAKVMKATSYEIRHYLPLEMFKLIDVTSGFLPFSVRLQLQEHIFEIAFTCEKEKAVWSAALCSARDTGMDAPLARPCSVSMNPPRSRRQSTHELMEAVKEGVSTATSPVKRHSLLARGHSRQHSMPAETSVPVPMDFEPHHRHSLGPPPSPSSPSMPTFSREPSASSLAPSSLLLRRPAPAYQAMTDQVITDVCSESCVTARLTAVHENAANTSPRNRPGSALRNRLSMRDSSMLVRRRSGYMDVISQPSSPEMSNSVTLTTLGRSRSSYGFTRKSIDRSLLVKRMSASEVERLGLQRSGSEKDLTSLSPLKHNRPLLDTIAGSTQHIRTLKDASKDRGNRTSISGTPRSTHSSPSTPMMMPSDGPHQLRHQASVPDNLLLEFRPAHTRASTLSGRTLAPPISMPPAKASPSPPNSSPGEGDHAEMFMLGAGITNTPGLGSSISAASSPGTVGSLRRSLSFKWFNGTPPPAPPKRERSSLNLSEMGIVMRTPSSEDKGSREELSEENGQGFGAGSSLASPPAPPSSDGNLYSRRNSLSVSEGGSSVPEDHSTTSSIGRPRPSRSGSSAGSSIAESTSGTAAGTGVATGLPPPPLRRRRSAKFFAGLNRLTSINRG